MSASTSTSVDDTEASTAVGDDLAERFAYDSLNAWWKYPGLLEGRDTKVQAVPKMVAEAIAAESKSKPEGDAARATGSTEAEKHDSDEKPKASSVDSPGDVVSAPGSGTTASTRISTLHVKEVTQNLFHDGLMPAESAKTAVKMQFVCPLCLEFTPLLVRSTCRHSACQECLDQQIKQNECPICRQTFKKSEDATACLHDMMRAIVVRCYFHPHCDWTGDRFDWLNHVKTCSLIHEDCRHCKSHTCRKKDMDVHTEKCPERPTVCDLCTATMPLSRFHEHKNSTCPRFRMPCPQGCGMAVMRGECDAHIRDECRKRPVDCVVIGCKATGLTADTLDAHMVSVEYVVTHVKGLLHMNADLTMLLKMHTEPQVSSGEYKLAPRPHTADHSEMWWLNDAYDVPDTSRSTERKDVERWKSEAGHLFLARDLHGIWCLAQRADYVVGRGVAPLGHIRVHFCGYDSKHDEDINMTEIQRFRVLQRRCSHSVDGSIRDFVTQSAFIDFLAAADYEVPVDYFSHEHPGWLRAMFQPARFRLPGFHFTVKCFAKGRATLYGLINKEQNPYVNRDMIRNILPRGTITSLIKTTSLASHDTARQLNEESPQ